MIDHDIPGVEVYGKGRGEFHLPCGYVDGTGKVHNTVIVRETTGEEEDILDENSLTVTERISRVLSACIEKLGEITDKALIHRAVSDTLNEGEGLALTNGDRLAGMLFLRRVSNGDIYHLTQADRTCPHCSTPAPKMHINLGQLEIKRNLDATKRRCRIELPRSKRVATIQVITAKGEEKLAGLSPATRDLRSLAILPRLVELDEEPLPQDTQAALKVVKALPTRDRQVIRQVYGLIEGSVDTDLDLRCTNPACGKDFKSALDLGQVFFSSPEEKVTLEDLEWV